MVLIMSQELMRQTHTKQLLEGLILCSHYFNLALILSVQTKRAQSETFHLSINQERGT